MGKPSKRKNGYSDSSDEEEYRISKRLKKIKEQIRKLEGKRQKNKTSKSDRTRQPRYHSPLPVNTDPSKEQSLLSDSDGENQREYIVVEGNCHNMAIF